MYYSIFHALDLPPAGSPSHDGIVAVYVFDINQPSLPTSVYSVLVSISVFMALSTVFYSIILLWLSGVNSALLIFSTIYVFMEDLS